MCTFVQLGIIIKLGSMKLSITLSALAFLALVNLGCSQSVTEPITTSDVVSIDEGEESHQKFKPKKNMIEVNGLKGEYTVKVGQQVYYAARVHSSVGYSAEVYSLGPGLKLTDNFTEYDQKQKRGLSGGDAATQYFVFEAVSVGKHTMTARRYFRGELKEDYTITINIE